MKVYTSQPHGVIKSAVGKLVEFISPTYGPAGKGILINKGYQQELLDDGFAAVEEFELEDELENSVIGFIKEATRKTNKRAGDGTTTSLILMASIVDWAIVDYEQSMLKPDLNQMAHDIRLAGKRVVATIRKQAKKIKTVEELAKIALNSYNDPAMSLIIAKLVHEVGKDGQIAIENSDSMETVAEVVKGMTIERGYISQYFSNPETGVASLSNPTIIITDELITSFDPILPVIEEKLKAGNKDFLIICEDLQGAALQSLVVNVLKKNINAVAIKAPGFGDNRYDLLEDIATMTGATFLTLKKGRPLSSITVADCGSAKKVDVNKDDTIIQNGIGKEADVKARVESIRLLTEIGTEFDKDKAKQRIAQLTGGIGVIKVGAATDTELKSVRMKVEDAVHSTKLAFKEGVIPSVGIIFSTIKSGNAILDAALQQPLNVLKRNGSKALSDDAQDAAGVAIASLESAISVGTALITSGGIIAPKKEKKDETR